MADQVYDDDFALWLLRLSDDDFHMVLEGLAQFGPEQVVGMARAVSAVRKAEAKRDG